MITVRAKRKNVSDTAIVTHAGSIMQNPNIKDLCIAKERRNNRDLQIVFEPNYSGD